MSTDDQPKLKSDFILENLAKKNDQTDQVQVDEDTVQLIIITVEECNYAVPAENVFEIGENRRIFPVPGTPGYVLGIQNLRGDIATIMSMNVLMRLVDRADGEGQRVVYSMHNDNMIGYLVDNVQDVIDFPISGIRDPISTLDKLRREFIQGEILYKEEHIPLLSLTNMFERAFQGLSSKAQN